jgi:hypothetical protein
MVATGSAVMLGSSAVAESWWRGLFRGDQLAGRADAARRARPQASVSGSWAGMRHQGERPVSWFRVCGFSPAHWSRLTAPRSWWAVTRVYRSVESRCL